MLFWLELDLIADDGAARGERVVMGLMGEAAVGGVGSGRREPVLASLVAEAGAEGSWNGFTRGAEATRL